MDKMKNKGLTLVELIVSIAVMAILGIGIGSFVYISLQQYKSAHSEVDIQYEAQVTQNKIQDMLIDASRGVSVSSSPNTTLYIYNYNEDEKKKYRIEIKYVPEKSQLQYTRYYIEDLAEGEQAHQWMVDGDAKDEYLAAYITGFEVILYDKLGKVISGPDSGMVAGKAQIRLNYSLGGREYQSDNTVKLRNSVLESTNIDVLYKKQS